MNKIKNVLLLILLIAQCEIAKSQPQGLFGKESWNGLSMMNLKSKVKSLIQTSYVAIDSSGSIKKGAKRDINDQISENVNSDCLILFDIKGRITEETYYVLLGKGGKYTPYRHTYDDVKNTEEIVYGIGPKGEIYMRFFYKYDAKGKMIEQFISQLIGENTRIDQKIVYKYDEKGNIMERINYSPKNNNLKTGDKTIYKYQNIEGQNIEEQYSEKGMLLYKNSYKVDVKGNKIEQTYYYSNGKILDHIFRFKYDDYGNEIEKKYYKPADKLAKIWTYKYEYDKSNNWIKRIDFENGKATFILERNLEYY